MSAKKQERTDEIELPKQLHHTKQRLLYNQSVHYCI